MMRRPATFFIGTLLASASLVACGGGSSTPSGTGGKSGTAGSTGAAGSATGAAGSATGAAGSTSGGAGSTGAAGSTSGGAGSTGAAGSTSGGAGSTGAAGSTSGGAGATGAAGSTTGGAGATGAGGAGSNKPAIATMAQANGNGVQGTATFTPDGTGKITLVLKAINCPGNGAHSFHIHQMADCGNDGINSGMIWSPKGAMLGTIMCNGGMGGMAMYTTPSAGYWTIGTGDATSDILLHSIVIDNGTEAMPGMPIACGVPRND